jgi:hypothetical protein
MMRKWEIVRPESGDESGMDANAMLRPQTSQRVRGMTEPKLLEVSQRKLTTKTVFLVESFQCSPRHIWHDVPPSINQSDICRLHERVAANNFKNSFVLSSTDSVALLRHSDFNLSGHVLPPALQLLAILRIRL